MFKGIILYCPFQHTVGLRLPCYRQTIVLISATNFNHISWNRAIINQCKLYLFEFKFPFQLFFKKTSDISTKSANILPAANKYSMCASELPVSTLVFVASRNFKFRENMNCLELVSCTVIPFSTRVR